MKIRELMATMTTAYKGRKPGMVKSKNPGKLLSKARELYGDDATFSIHLNRECCDEVPHIKKPTWDHLSPTQQYGVASRLHSKAVQRMRAAKMVMKSKSMYSAGDVCLQCGGMGSGCNPRAGKCGRKKGVTVHEKGVTRTVKDRESFRNLFRSDRKDEFNKANKVAKSFGFNVASNFKDSDGVSVRSYTHPNFGVKDATGPMAKLKERHGDPDRVSIKIGADGSWYFKGFGMSKRGSSAGNLQKFLSKVQQSGKHAKNMR